MATASTSANDLTRQQLDELDSLLQRMLSLPINPADPTPPPIPAATLTAFAPPLPPANFGAPTSYTAPPPTREAAPAAPPPARRPDPPATPAPAPRLFMAPVEEPPRPAPLPKPERKLEPKPQPKAEQPQPQPVVPRPRPQPVEVAEPVAAELPFAQPEPAAPPSEPVPILFAPLVLFNRLLNGALGMLGLPGRVLRSGFVKNLFGLAGFGLILYTGAKVAQVHGWVSLPVQLPWPR